MKTFDEKDLITWANREKAIIGNEYYFGNDTNIELAIDTECDKKIVIL